MSYLESGSIEVTAGNGIYRFVMQDIKMINGFIVSGFYTGKPTCISEYV